MPDKKPTLQIILASTRPGRAGAPVASWFEQRAREHGGFDVELVDLAEVALPFVDEPMHPAMRQYTQQHTRDWSASVERADAFAFVTCEYNFGYPATLKNAIDFLYHEWMYKPVGLVSYGGVAAGTRSAEALKQVLNSVKLSPLGETVAIPFVQELLAEDGSLAANEIMDTAAAQMLDELVRVEGALAPLREGVRSAVAA